MSENTEELSQEERQAAVIAEIMSAAVLPHAETDTSTSLALEIDEWGSSLTCRFNRWSNHHLVQAEDDKISHIVPSNVALDRFVAAWINWRVKYYEQPKEDNGGLGDLDDHPF